MTNIQASGNTLTAKAVDATETLALESPSEPLTTAAPAAPDAPSNPGAEVQEVPQASTGETARAPSLRKAVAKKSGSKKALKAKSKEPVVSKAPAKKAATGKTNAKAPASPKKASSKKGPAKKAAAKATPPKQVAAKKAISKKSAPQKAKAVKSVAGSPRAGKSAAPAAPTTPVKGTPSRELVRGADKAKAKLVRDSFTMPAQDFGLVAVLKDRALGFKRPAKKSELLRAGLHALQQLTDARLRRALDALMPLKPGRPKKKGN